MYIPLRYIIEDDDPYLLRRFTAYIELVVAHARIDYLRKYDRHIAELSIDDIKSDEEPAYEEPLPITGNGFDFGEDRLSNAFSDLSLLCQRVLTLIFVEGLSARETADKLNCSVNYVYVEKHRVINALRDQLMEEGCRYGK